VDKPKLFVDEDACEDAVVSALRRLGFDVLTVLDVGRAGIEDMSNYVLPPRSVGPPIL
jgi:hypothetical protein